MVKIVNQDLLAVKEGVIAHQCNNRGVMGAGLARAIAAKWPEAYLGYRQEYERKGLSLGDVIAVQVGTKLFVANIIAQDGYGREQSRVYTDYDALRLGLRATAALARWGELPLYLPYGIGCGLGGGDWDVVFAIIVEEVPEAILCKPWGGKGYV